MYIIKHNGSKTGKFLNKVFLVYAQVRKVKAKKNTQKAAEYAAEIKEVLVL